MDNNGKRMENAWKCMANDGFSSSRPTFELCKALLRHLEVGGPRGESSRDGLGGVDAVLPRGEEGGGGVFRALGGLFSFF